MVIYLELAGEVVDGEDDGNKKNAAKTTLLKNVLRLAKEAKKFPIKPTVQVEIQARS